MNNDSRESTKTTKDEPLTFKAIDFPTDVNDITPTTLVTETSAQEEQPINPIATKPTDHLNNSEPSRETLENPQDSDTHHKD